MSKFIISSMLQVQIASAMFAGQQHHGLRVAIPHGGMQGGMQDGMQDDIEGPRSAKRKRVELTHEQCMAAACYRAGIDAHVYREWMKQKDSEGGLSGLDFIRKYHISGAITEQLMKNFETQFSHTTNLFRTGHPAGKMIPLEATMLLLDEDSKVDIETFNRKKNQLRRDFQAGKVNREWDAGHEAVLTALENEYLRRGSISPASISPPGVSPPGSGSTIPMSNGSTSNDLAVNHQLNVQLHQLKVAFERQGGELNTARRDLLAVNGQLQTISRRVPEEAALKEKKFALDAREQDLEARLEDIVAREQQIAEREQQVQSSEAMNAQLKQDLHKAQQDGERRSQRMLKISQAVKIAYPDKQFAQMDDVAAYVAKQLPFLVQQNDKKDASITTFLERNGELESLNADLEKRIAAQEQHHARERATHTQLKQQVEEVKAKIGQKSNVFEPIDLTGLD